jgi:hypothetical protein
MNETASYLDQFARTTADVRIATVESRNDDGSYNVRYVDSQALDRAAKANPVDEFAIGSRIVVQTPSNSRAVVGANPVIVSRAPREQRGLSGTTPTTTRESFAVPTITGIDPDPLILEAGGDPGEQVIMGFGFGADEAEYFAVVGADPTLLEEDPQIITPTKITVSVSADAGSPLGEFSVGVGGAKAVAKALRIVEKPPVPLEMRLYLGGRRAGAAVVIEIDPVTLAELRVFVGATGPSTRTTRIIAEGETLYWTSSTDAATTVELSVTDIGSGVTTAILGSPPWKSDTFGAVTVGEVGGIRRLIFTGEDPFSSFPSARGLWRADIDGTNATRFYAATETTMRGVLDLGADIITASSSAALKRITKDTGTVTHSQATAVGTRIAAVGGLLVVTASGTNTYIVNAADLALLATLGVAGSGVVALGSLAYMPHFGGNVLRWVDPVAQTTGVLTTLTSAGPRRIVTDGTYLYVWGETDLKFRKIATDGTIVTTGPAISNDIPFGPVALFIP